MEIISKLAFSLNRRDEVPNQELAAEILAAADSDAIAQLFANLTNKVKGIRYDCIKVIYEIGYQKPGLIAPHFAALLNLLDTKDNRMQWGVMITLGCLANEKQRELARSCQN